MVRTEIAERIDDIDRLAAVCSLEGFVYVSGPDRDVCSMAQ
jgi:hypothetical protein